MRDLFVFEGTPQTLAQIRACVPVLSDHTIRRHLAEGRTTRVAMLSYNGRAALSAAGRKGRAAAERTGAFRNSLKASA